MITERKGFSLNGYFSLVLLAGLQIASVYYAYNLFINEAALVQSTLSACVVLLVAYSWTGFFIIQPNQAVVLIFYGSYAGTVKTNGLHWTIPLFSHKNVSLRIRNFESGQLKVNDKQGSPIEIAAVIVWSVKDAAEAIFEVEDYESYVKTQSESALRNMATSYPYDQHDTEEIALRSHPQQVASALEEEVHDRLKKAGVTVHEARISHLAYAPEIASAMLQRQQASAIIAARSKIVEGAVGMVEMALSKLSQQEIVELDEERKAVMVSNLLVVLCGDKSMQPVVNAGSIY